MALPIFIDIDGTLTSSPRAGGSPIEHRIKRVADMLSAGTEIVLWSASGTKYARAFAERCGLSAAVCIGKPSLMVDDNPTIRPAGRLPIKAPEDFF